MITVKAVPFDDATARELWDAQQAELLARYGEEDVDAVLEDEGIIASLVGEQNGAAVATGMIRWSPYDTPPGTAEAKRLYLVPEHRGHGHSRVMMGVLEDAARRAGATQIVVETGVKQPEAIGLYEAIGYSRIEPYGSYKEHADSVCLGKQLPTRVLVISGTMGAGKSTTSGAASGVLTDRGVRHVRIDVDELYQAFPMAEQANYSMMFETLTALAPIYRSRGYGALVLAIVAEHQEDRANYTAAFAGPGGPAEVSIALLTAPEAERLSRLNAREPEGRWQEFAAHRTVELAAILEELSLQDVTVENFGRTVTETAIELLEAVGW